MNPKTKLFWSQFIMTAIVLAIFFATDAMNSGVILTRLIVALVLFTMFAALGAAAPAAISAGIATLAAFTAGTAGPSLIMTCIGSIVFVIAMIILTTIFYAKENGFTKKRVILSVVTEFIAILIPMLYAILK